MPPHTPTRGDQGDPPAAGDDQASLGHAIDRGKGDRRGGEGRAVGVAGGGDWVALSSWTTDDTKQCATLLGLQVQRVVARVNFPHEGTRVYIKLSGNC
jgi:hypothetical protein